MNPCTPNHVEVLESRSIPPKIEDTEITSPVAERPSESSETDPENQAAVSYCPPIIEEEITNPAADEAGGAPQVVYIDVQSMCQPQAEAEDEEDADPVVVAGYKPQMRLPIDPAAEDTAAEDEADKTAGYRPQTNVNAWNLVSPDSPRSTDSNSEVVSFGSPCSTCQCFESLWAWGEGQRNHIKLPESSLPGCPQKINTERMKYV